jgi:hypothetical protein
MRRPLFGLFLIMVIGGSANAQAAKSVFLELGGPGLISFNFDTRFSGKEDGIGGRAGIGALGIDGHTILFTPLGINYLIGTDGRDYFELGGGITPVILTGTSPGPGKKFTTSFGHLLFGYRMQPATGGFMMRGFICPVFSKDFFAPYYAGLSVGYKFRREKGKK